MYAAESFRRAEAAQKNGWFEDEIVPITSTVTDPKTGTTQNITITKDECLRHGTTLEGLSRVRLAASEHGDKSARGNACQVSDGGAYFEATIVIDLLLREISAAAVMLMKRFRPIELGLPVLAQFCGAVAAGVPPRIMGTGPACAIPRLLGKFCLDKDDVDIFEVNEAFASMSIYCMWKLGLVHSKVNPRGGATA